MYCTKFLNVIYDDDFIESLTNIAKLKAQRCQGTPLMIEDRKHHAGSNLKNVYHPQLHLLSD